MPSPLFLGKKILYKHEMHEHCLFLSRVSKIHHQPCHVVYTDYRPVPLQHYLFPANAEGIFLVVDEKAKFRDDNFQRAMSTLQTNPLGEFEVSNDANGGGNDKKSRKQLTKNFQNDLLKIVKLIMERSLDPCIIFSFSKKDCETYALQMSKMDFNKEDEKFLIEQVFNNAIDALSEDDKQLPQIITLLPLLKRGIGIHHGGLLPILKEIIEILFQEGLIKLLFATETFSIGINMPAKTVVFTATRKYDGKDFRWITSGEYIQMSGRAGRRGKDDKGIVIQMIDEKMEPDVVKNMIYGASDPLYSSYHISYNMVLNMLRVEGADPSNLIKSSFHQYQQEANAPNLLIEAQELEREKAAILVEEESVVEEYFTLKELLSKLHEELNQKTMISAYILPFLQNGRLLQLQHSDILYGWGVIVDIKKTSEILGNAKHMSKHLNMSYYLGKLTPKKLPDSEYILEIMIEVCHLSSRNKDNGLDIAPRLLQENGHTDSSSGQGKNEMMLIQCGLDCISTLSAIKLNIPKDLSKEKYRLNIKNCINEILRRFGNNPAVPSVAASTDKKESSGNKEGVPYLDPKTDLGINDPNIDKIYQLMDRKSDVIERLEHNKYSNISKLESPVVQSYYLKNLEKYQTKQQLTEEILKLKKQANELQSVIMKDELRKMKKLLKKLEYIDMENILTTKGRFACEITAGDEIIITNMVFSGLFNELSIEQTVALLSCFVHSEGAGGGSGGSGSASEQSILKFRSEMHKPYRNMLQVIKEVIHQYKDCHMNVDENDYINSFNPILIDVTYAWAKGQKFVEICKISEVFEGSIIRSLRRLDELLRQLAAASLSIGNHELVTMFTEGSNKIRRGVVFAASLYI